MLYSVLLLVKDTEELADRIPHQSPHQNQTDSATSPDQMAVETSTTSSSSFPKKNKSDNYPTELFEYDEHVPLVFIQNPGTQEAVEWTRFRDACKLFANARQVETAPPEWSLYQLGSEQTVVTGHLTVKHEKTAPRGYCGEKSQKGTEQDTGAIFVQESHPNNSDVYSLTLMEPIVSYEPRPAYVQQCIIPKGLTSRDWQPNGREAIDQTFPPPKLGEKAGRGLDIIYPELDYLGSKKPLDLGVPLMSTHRTAVKQESGKNTQPHLLIRRLVQYQPLTDEKRTKVFDILRAYSEHILNRAIEWCLCQPVRSPRAKRNPSFGMSASIFDASILSKDTNRVIPNTTESVDEGGAEKRLSATPAPESVLSSSEASHVGLDFWQTDGATMTPAQKSAYDAMRRELEKAKRNKAVLRDRSVPNYFRFVQGLKFLLKQGPNPTNVTNELSTNQALDANNDLKDYSKDKPMRTGSTQNICKPISPPFLTTPSGSTDVLVEETGTSGTAEKNVPLSYNDLTKKQEIPQKYVYYRPSNQAEDQKHQVPLDAVAQARYRRLRVPKYLYAFRPQRNSTVDDISDDRVGFMTLNHKHAIVEDPVRRKALFTSLISGPENGQRALRAMRGLRLQPSRVDCGQLPVGCVRMFRLRLVNWGPETAFFRVKQPEKASGVQVTYTPGPIPAGLSRDLHIKVCVTAQPHSEQISDRARHSIHWTDERIDSLDGGSPITIDQQFFKYHIKLITDTHIMTIPICGQIKF